MLTSAVMTENIEIIIKDGVNFKNFNVQIKSKILQLVANLLEL